MPLIKAVHPDLCNFGEPLGAVLRPMLWKWLVILLQILYPAWVLIFALFVMCKASCRVLYRYRVPMEPSNQKKKQSLGPVDDQV